MTRPFNLGSFQEILDIYGADTQRWPGDTRMQAEEFLKHSDEAQSLYMEALKLDAAIKPRDLSQPPEDLLDKILQQSKK